MTDSVELRLASDSSTPRTARRALATTFYSHPRLDDVLLCLSEVVTNAVLYAGTDLTVTAEQRGDTVRVEVADGSTAEPQRRVFESISPTGRGLHLLDRLTDAWGVVMNEHGKTVWFEISGGGR